MEPGTEDGERRDAARYRDERTAAGDRAVRRRATRSESRVCDAGLEYTAYAAGEVLRGTAPAAGRNSVRRPQPVRQGGLPAAPRASGARAEAARRGVAAGGGGLR